MKNQSGLDISFLPEANIRQKILEKILEKNQFLDKIYQINFVDNYSLGQIKKVKRNKLYLD